MLHCVSPVSHFRLVACAHRPLSLPSCFLIFWSLFFILHYLFSDFFCWTEFASGSLIVLLLNSGLIVLSFRVLFVHLMSSIKLTFIVCLVLCVRPAFGSCNYYNPSNVQTNLTHLPRRRSVICVYVCVCCALSMDIAIVH